MVTLDDARRETMLQDAMATAIRDTALVPLYTQMTISASRNAWYGDPIARYVEAPRRAAATMSSYRPAPLA